MTKKDILEWDIATWSRALRFWEKTILAQNINLQNGLEIGAHNGGISLFFAKKYGAKMVCSDLEPASAKAKSLHDKHKVSRLIEYAGINASAIPYPDDSFDFVVFKSVLGGIGRNGQAEKQKQALAEIHRVLKPGGVLFFAENMRGSVLHRLARRVFMPWGKSWRYLKIKELRRWLSIFESHKIRTTGFFAAFVPKPEWLKTLAAKVDLLFFYLPQKWEYVAYGFARK
ncbi:MAG: class I SAM-dependent methyltransferase [Lewinellaceae bacterium]|nr:class I SAM-dependent methyltransferase [Lewinellaceae bacterium]